MTYDSNDPIHIFESVPLNDDSKNKKSEIDKSAIDLMENIYKYVPDCRERHIAITRLIECVMWLNRTISRNQ